MASTERPVLVAVITTMGVIIAALITSGILTRNSAERREDALEARVRVLEAELRKRAKPPGHTDSPRQSDPPVPTIDADVPAPMDVAGLAARLAQQKKTEILSPANSVRGVMAKDATKEYVFVGTANVPLLFSLAQPAGNFWSDIDIQSSIGAPLLQGESFSDHNDQFTFTPPKDDAYVLKVRGTRKFGDFVIAVAPLGATR